MKMIRFLILPNAIDALAFTMGEEQAEEHQTQWQIHLEEMEVREEAARQRVLSRQAQQRARAPSEDNILAIAEACMQQLPYGSIGLLIQAAKESLGYERAKKLFEFQDIFDLPQIPCQRGWDTRTVSDFYAPSEFSPGETSIRKIYREEIENLASAAQDGATPDFNELPKLKSRIEDLLSRISDGEKQRLWSNTKFADINTTAGFIHGFESAARDAHQQHRQLLIPLPSQPTDPYNTSMDSVPAQHESNWEKFEQLQTIRDNRFRWLYRVLTLVIILSEQALRGLPAIYHHTPVAYDRESVIAEYKKVLNLDGSENNFYEILQRIAEWKVAQKPIIAAESDFLTASHFDEGSFAYCAMRSEMWLAWLHSMVQDNRIDHLLHIYEIGAEPTDDDWVGLDDVRDQVESTVPAVDDHGIQMDYSQTLSEKLDELQKLVQTYDQSAHGHDQSRHIAWLDQFRDDRDRATKMCSPFTSIFTPNLEKRCEFVRASRSLVEDSLLMFANGRLDQENPKTSLAHFEDVKQRRNHYFLNFQRAIALVITITEQHLVQLQ